MTIPSTLFKKVIDHICQSKKYEILNYDGYDSVFISCKEKTAFDDVFFSVNGVWLQMRPEDYIVEENGYCYLKFNSDVKNKERNWKFDLSLLSGYYTVFEYGDPKSPSRIGFAPRKDSSKVHVGKESFKSKEMDNWIDWQDTWMFDLYRYIYDQTGIDIFVLFSFSGSFVSLFLFVLMLPWI